MDGAVNRTRVEFSGLDWTRRIRDTSEPVLYVILLYTWSVEEE